METKLKKTIAPQPYMVVVKDFVPALPVINNISVPNEQIPENNKPGKFVEKKLMPEQPSGYIKCRQYDFF